jgi:Domain of unknown function (DUF4372)
MQVGRPLFSQVMDFIPWTSFDRLVEKYDCDKNTTRLQCSAQFRAMAFAQMTFRESLRDIEASLNAHPSKLYGMGFRNPVAKSTLADANEMRDWRLWQELATFLSGARANFTRRTTSALISTTRRMRSTARLSTYACPCFHGPIFVRQKQRSRCTR